MWPFKPDTERQYRANYTDQVLDSDWASVTGGGSHKADQMGRVQFGVQLFVSAFAAAEVRPALPALSPEIMAGIAQRLLIRGNALFAIDVDMGGLRLLPVHTWDIGGDANPSTWRYALDLAGPSRDETRRVSGDGLVHCRIGANTASPWLGISPLSAAGLTSRMLTNLETRLGDETSTRAGYVVAHPPGIAQETITKLRSRMAKMTGGNGLIEANAGGDQMQRGMGRAFDPIRLGADVPQYNVELRDDVAHDALAALGINPMLVHGDGSAIRESYRQAGALLHGMAALVSAELSAKLDTDLEIRFPRLAATDVAAKARAVGTYVSNGMPIQQALDLVGVED